MAFVRIVLVYDVQNRTADANSAKQRECQHLLIRSLQLFKLAASYSFFSPFGKKSDSDKGCGQAAK